MSWCPREKVLPSSSAMGASSMGWGADQVTPPLEEESTMRASPVAPRRSCQARWSQLRVAAASTEMARLGRVWLLKAVGVMAWSKGAMFATTEALDQVWPPSVEEAIMIASVSLELA
ncbi:MAG: hypothetical protein QM767_01680 [Anaeromyxobacter sp.]